MKTKRPIYLNLLQYRFPVTAICSILHRISGALIFLLLPFLLWALGKSLSSADNFNFFKESMNGWVVFWFWVIASAIIVHILAGMRHLLMDIGIGEDLKAGRASAYLVMVLSVLLIIAAGVWLW